MPQLRPRAPRRYRNAAVVLTALSVGLVGLVGPASAEVRVSRAELKGTQLRVEGTALPNRPITVNGTVLGSSDGSGAFKVQSSTFDHGTSCVIQVNDGSSTSTPITPSGCTTQSSPPAGATGTVGILPANGHGVITSSPSGINCVIAASGASGPCTARFAAGTVVRLDVRPDADSAFVGWRGVPGCADGSKVTIAANVNITCEPGLVLK